MIGKMKLFVFCFLVILHCSYAPPVGESTQAPEDDPEWANYMEYHRYLKEVVQALESDPDFKTRLEKASDDDIKTGKLAEQLDFVNHNVRTKLDEIKRRELDRLRHLATKQYELENDLDVNGKVTNEHLDHGNPHTFEIEDLKKLIKKATADLEAVDKKRRDEFKEYEMQKKFEEQKKMEDMDENQKKEYMDKLKKDEDAIKHHEPLHHPVTKEQLLDVWKNADDMDSKDFNPKVFFMMHDVDGNGVWDADEVKALFIKELDKLYSPNGPNKDLHERAEEMERMREHVFKEYDTNQDGLIEIGEFLAVTQKDQFNKDEGWKTIDDNQIYTQNEYEEYERTRLEEFKYLQSLGLVDVHGKPLPGSDHQIHQALVQYRAYKQQQAYQQQFQHQQPHPGQPVYYPQGQVPQGQNPQYQQPQQVHQQGQVPQYQVPQGQFQAQQPPQGQFQAQQQPQGQLNSQQPVQSQFQGQQPQGNFQGQQPPQGQFQGQQAPQAQFQQPPQGLQSQPAQNNPAPAPPVPQAQPVPIQHSQGQASPVQGQPQQAQNNNPAPQVPPAQAQNQIPPANLGAHH